MLDSPGTRRSARPDNDELLGRHGSDRLLGGEGKDILWSDWDPSTNTTHQKDLLDGGPGNDWIHPSHGPPVVKAGGCLKPGDTQPTAPKRRGRAAWVAAHAVR